MKFSNLRNIPWKWYYIAIFCLPGGTFLVSALLAFEVKKGTM